MIPNYELTELERKIIKHIPDLFPDGDSDDLITNKHVYATREKLSYALGNLLELEIISASIHDGENPFAPYYRNIELTGKGEHIRRRLSRNFILIFFASEWKWLVSTAISIVAIIISIFSFIHNT